MVQKFGKDDEIMILLCDHQVRTINTEVHIEIIKELLYYQLNLCNHFKN